MDPRVLVMAAVVGGAGALAQEARPVPGPTGASRVDVPASPAAPARDGITPLAHVAVRGTGPVPMVLIPNLVMDWTIFESFMERNASRYTMYAVTLPGFGGSAPPPEPAESTSYAAASWMTNAERAVMRLIEEKKLERPVVLGQSLGGHVALRLALDHPAAFRGVIVINSMAAVRLGEEALEPGPRASRVDGEIAASIRRLPDEEWKKSQAAWVTGSLPDATPAHRARARSLVEKADAVPKVVSSRYMLEYFAADLTGRVRSIEAPLLVIAPAGPVLNPHWKAMREEWKSQFGPAPRGTLVFFEDSGEFITEDSPSELDRAVEQFLEGRMVSGKTALPGIPPPPPATTTSDPAPKPVDARPGEPGRGEPKPSEPK